MNRLSLEHTDDAVIRSIKETISSIIPKDAKVILLVREPEMKLWQIRIGTFLCF